MEKNCLHFFNRATKLRAPSRITQFIARRSPDLHQHPFHTNAGGVVFWSNRIAGRQPLRFGQGRVAGFARHRLAQHGRSATEVGVSRHLDQIAGLQVSRLACDESQAGVPRHHETRVRSHMHNLPGRPDALKHARLRIEQQQFRGLL